MKISSILLAILTVLLGGCGSMAVWRVGKDVPVGGLRVQVPVQHDIVFVTKDAAGKRVVKQTQMSLPAPDEFYELDFKGGQFRSRVLNVTVHPNGTLKSYSFTTKQLLSETLQAASEATDTLRTAFEEVTAEPEVPNATQVENAQLELDLLNLMLKANLDALRNGDPLPFPEILGD